MTRAARKRLAVAFARSDVRCPELRVKRRGAGATGFLPVAVEEGLPTEPAALRARGGPQVGHVSVQKADGVGAYLLVLLIDKVGPLSAAHVLEHVTEVGDRCGRSRPRLFDREVAHVGPGVERLDEPRDVHLPALPAKASGVAGHPDL